MVWHFCAAFNCNVSTRKILQCTEGCKIKHAKAPCTVHPRAYPELQNVKFLTFPKNTDCRQQWVNVLGRQDLVKASDITYNHRLCSLHFPDRLPVYEDELPTNFDLPPYLQKKPPKQRSYRTRTTSVTTPETPKAKATKKTSENIRTKQNDDTVSPVPLVEEATEMRTRDCDSPCLDSDSLDTDLNIQTNTNGDTDTQIHSNHTEDKSCQTNTKTTATIGTQTELSGNEDSLMRQLFMKATLRDDKSVKFYLGLPSLAMFTALLSILTPVANKMTYWTGGKTGKKKPGVYQSVHKLKKCGAKRKLNVSEEFVLVLMRLRLGLLREHLARLFGVSPSTVTNIFATWVNMLHSELGGLVQWPTREMINRHMPISFKLKYPATRVILDCTEMFVNKPVAPTAQSVTWSNYKQHNTFKCLVGITPSGAFSFISRFWGGSISDREIVIRSGLLDKLEPGDDVMADRGFVIRDLVTDKMATLNIPPFSKGRQLTASQVTRTRRIASLRIHVERAIERLKNYKILSVILPLSLRPYMDQIVLICAALCNLQEPLVH